jgi:hypothetical protein
MELLVRDGTFVLGFIHLLSQNFWAKVRGSGYFMNKRISAKVVP